MGISFQEELGSCFFRHATSPSLANIQGGITIDLSRLNQVIISPDQSYVSVGPGNRWSDVYTEIETRGLAVSGGRWGNVGVGGLLTGGELQ
jgi:FAD/FMN-containing dehydrogenase